MTEPSVQLAVWKPVFTAELRALIRHHGIDAEADCPATVLAEGFLVFLNHLQWVLQRREAYVRTGWQAGAARDKELGA